MTMRTSHSKSPVSFASTASRERADYPERPNPGGWGRANTFLQDIDGLLQLLAIGHAVGEGSNRSAEACGVDLLSHALQCADLLAIRHPEDTELQIAGLLHDIGHHVPLTGQRDRRADHDLAHGREGARIVGPLLGERVAGLVQMHVDAKRFLITFDPRYAAVLSAASTETLERQGGRMTSREARGFAADRDFASAIALRRADDEAKDPTRATSSLASWRGKLLELAWDRTTC
jgi:predicted HD phosphohydrolase